MKTFVSYCFAIWLGAAPGILWGINLLDWKWWVLVVPLNIVFNIRIMMED